MYMPPNVRVKSTVAHYLDSVNSPSKVELVWVIKIRPENIDSYYENDKKQSIQLKTDSEKRIYGIDTVETSEAHSFSCAYRINGIEHEAEIQLDTALSKVTRFIEMHN